MEYKKQTEYPQIKEQIKPNKNRDTEKTAVVTRGKGDQLHTDGRKLNFWCEHTIVYTEVETYYRTHETDIKSLQMVTAAMKLKDTYSLEGKL